MKTTSELKKYITLDADFDFSILKPHLDLMMDSYIADLMGTELFAKYKAYLIYDPNVDEESTFTNANIPSYDSLVFLVDRAVSNIAMFDWLAVGSVSISDNGLQRIEGEVSGLTRKSAYQYQEKNVKEYYRNNGFKALDAIVTYLIFNIEQFEEFKTAALYSEATSCIIPDTFTFNQHYFINGSNLLFFKIKQYIREAELFDIVPAIGVEMYNDIKANLTNSDVKALLPELRSAIAYKAIARGIEMTSVNIAEDGARLVVKDSNTANFEKTSLPDLTHLIAAASTTADRYIGLLCQNIRANLSKYPKYVDNRTTPLDVTDKKFIPLY